MARSLQVSGRSLSYIYSPEDSISKIDIGALTESESRLSLKQGMRVSHPIATRSRGHYFNLEDSRKILDACGGAGVASIGHGNRKVLWAIFCQSLTLTYVPWAFFDNLPTLKLWKWLEQSTGGKLPVAYLTSSGSEAIEAAIKLSREYFVWKGEPQRVNFIAREESYHGTTIGSLSMSGHLTRRAPFEDILLPNVYRVSACNPYRQKLAGESDADYVTRKAEELDRAFKDAGPGTVAAFIAEPLVGAAMGCVPSPPGYFRAMREVCDKNGALLILDEVMCGMGRTGTLHAWEQEGVVPDIQTIGKGLAGGYQPASAVLVSEKVVQEMWRAGATFTHGHTFQNHASVSAAALKVQELIQRGQLLANVQVQGRYLEKLLKQRLGAHPHVGDIRGRGLFWGIEFVRDRLTKEPFDPSMEIARRVHVEAMNAKNPMMIYHGQGCAGNRRGDHVMIMPAYNVTSKLIMVIVDRLVSAVNATFEDI